MSTIDFDPLIQEMFQDLGQMLYKIYLEAFPSEIKCNRSLKEQEDWDRSEKNLFDWLKRYDLTPNLLSITMVIQMYQESKTSKPAYHDTSLKIV